MLRFAGPGAGRPYEVARVEKERPQKTAGPVSRARERLPVAKTGYKPYNVSPKVTVMNTLICSRETGTRGQ